MVLLGGGKRFPTPLRRRRRRAFSPGSLMGGTFIILYPVKDTVHPGERTGLTHQGHCCELHGQQQDCGWSVQHGPHLSPRLPSSTPLLQPHLTPLRATHSLLHMEIPSRCSKYHSGSLSSRKSFLAPPAWSQLFHWFLLSLRTLGCIDRKPNSTGLSNKGNL